MSTHNTSDEIRQIEETLQSVLRHELDARSTEFRDAGVHAELDPISRSGQGSNYTSFIEATLRYQDHDVHDIVFFFVAREGRLMVDIISTQQWIIRTLDESLSKALRDKPA
jgi:hypothetical protein